MCLSTHHSGAGNISETEFIKEVMDSGCARVFRLVTPPWLCMGLSTHDAGGTHYNNRMAILEMIANGDNDETRYHVGSSIMLEGKTSL